MEAFEHALYTLWQPDESRAELHIESGSGQFKITVFSCSDTVNINFKDGKVEINLDGRTDQSEALGCD